MAEIWTILILFIVALIATFPLYLAVKFLGGKTTLLHTFLVNIAVAVIIAIVQLIFPGVGQIISFLIASILYMNFFKIGFLRALLLGLIEFIIIILLVALLVALGIGTLGVALFV